MVKNQLEQQIIEILSVNFSEHDFSELKIVFQVPKDKQNGDLSTNIAMQLTKKTGSSPQEVAQKIIEGLKNSNIIDKVEVAGPGFLNFFLSNKDLYGKLDEMIKEGNDYGQLPILDSAINVEYVSVNPTGDLHVGHARGAVYGDVIAAILQKVGYQVTKEYYVNDAGNQISKLGHSVYIRFLQELGEDVEMIADGYHGQDIFKIAKVLVTEHENEVLQLTRETDRINYCGEVALKMELAQIKKDLLLINVHHDVWFSERVLYKTQAIEKTLAELKERNMTYELDGAIWLKSTKFGDDKDRVLEKTDGTFTYLTPDISYHLDKLARLATENKKLINIWGGDHHGYVARMKAALQTLGYPEDILQVELIQMVRFIQDGQEVKMSKRTGNSITMRELVEEVGVDVVRYFFSMRSCDTPLDFDMDLAKEESNVNPVYYAQYAYARICSIIKKAQDVMNVEKLELNQKYDLLIEDKERELANKLNQYVDVLQMAATRLEPFKLTNYIHELAASFHAFYNVIKVVDEENLELTTQRLKLLLATKSVLESSFAIIGITARETM